MSLWGAHQKDWWIRWNFLFCEIKCASNKADLKTSALPSPESWRGWIMTQSGSVYCWTVTWMFNCCAMCCVANCWVKSKNQTLQTPLSPFRHSSAPCTAPTPLGWPVTAFRTCIYRPTRYEIACFITSILSLRYKIHKQYHVDTITHSTLYFPVTHLIPQVGGTFTIEIEGRGWVQTLCLQRGIKKKKTPDSAFKYSFHTVCFHTSTLI